MSPLDRLGWLRALALTSAPGYALRVAGVLAYHANSESGEARPGLRNALGPDTSKRGAAWLRAHGWVSVTDRPGKPAVYILTRGTDAPGALMHPVQESTHTRGTEAPGPGAPVPPEPGIQGKNQGVGEPSEKSHLGGDPMMTFPIKGGGTWTMTPDLLTVLTRAHPGKSIPQELHRAAAWLVCNPTKAKTAAGMKRFLNGWMERTAGAVPMAGVSFPALPPEEAGEDDDIRYMPAARRVRA